MVACILSTRIWSTIVLCLSLHTVFAKQVHSKNLATIESTCPSRTINYITATLPQQCLRTDWSSTKSITTTGESSVTATSINPSTSTSATATNDEQDAESDPLSDKANFLSFEDWKAQMLQKSGQSPEHVAGSSINQRKETRGAGINNALDGYGEDGEIEIDFGGFPIPGAITNSALPTANSESASKIIGEAEDGGKPQKKSKEAGTTSKHRFNYASFDCAATVLKTNTGSKGSTSILSENKDSYMINACSLKNKFIIVELCSDINIDTLVLGNFEFFSSTFRSFRVSVADRYPVKSDKWENLGTFEARNTRGIQSFLVENMRIWARYLRIEFLTHYGAEYYCPVSLLRVHGKTMIDDWKGEVKASQGDDDADDEEEVEETAAEQVATASMMDSKPSSTEIPTQIPTEIVKGEPEGSPDYSFYDDKCPRISLPGPLVEQVELLSSQCDSHWRFCNMAKVQRVKYTSIVYPDVRVSVESNQPSQPVTGKDEKAKADNPKRQGSQVSVSSISKLSTQSDATAKIPSMSTTAKASQQPSEPTAAIKSSESRSATSAKSNTNAIASTVPQDSFFRSIHKRLQQLEANSTLSLQYIEEQSRILREAFNKVEKRQLLKTSSFLETLNATVLHELRQFKLQYDQIWQSTVLELSAQREQSQREVTALSQRLTLLADEILWQKRLAILQFTLILLCLALVVFSSRNNATGIPTFDLPLLQNMVNKSSDLVRLARSTSRPTTPLDLSSSSTSHQPPLQPWTTQFKPLPNHHLSDGDGDEEEAAAEAAAVLRTAETNPHHSGTTSAEDDLDPDPDPDPDPDAEAAYQLPTPTSELDEEHRPGQTGMQSIPAPALALGSALRHAHSDLSLRKELSFPLSLPFDGDGVDEEGIDEEIEEQESTEEEEDGEDDDEEEAGALARKNVHSRHAIVEK